MGDRPQHLLDPHLAARIASMRIKPWQVRCGRFFRLDAEISTSVVPEPLDVRERDWLVSDELRRIGQATKKRWG